MKKMTFKGLVKSICSVHEKLSLQAARAINMSLTVRNWVIGYYIEEYERAGLDRAKYGEKLMETLSLALMQQGISRCDRRELYRYRRFYLIYPQIVETVTPQLLPERKAAFKNACKKVETLSAQFTLSGDDLTSRLSFSHLAALVAQKAEPDRPELAVRDPYVFEFLGLKSRDVMGESRLEDALLDRLQDFLLELGHGFCFEARQKRIVIGGEYCFIDLVFYHRILKCHVLIELKADT